LKRTLKRELKALEIIKEEAFVVVIAWVGLAPSRVIRYPLFSGIRVPFYGFRIVEGLRWLCSLQFASSSGVE